MNIYTKRHLGYLRHFEKRQQTKTYGIYALKKACRGFYVSQNILPTYFEIDQIQNIIDISN
jgi:hypothetical protein